MGILTNRVWGALLKEGAFLPKQYGFGEKTNELSLILKNEIKDQYSDILDFDWDSVIFTEESTHKTPTYLIPGMVKYNSTDPYTEEEIDEQAEPVYFLMDIGDNGGITPGRILLFFQREEIGQRFGVFENSEAIKPWIDSIMDEWSCYGKHMGIPIGDRVCDDPDSAGLGGMDGSLPCNKCLLRNFLGEE